MRTKCLLFVSPILAGLTWFAPEASGYCSANAVGLYQFPSLPGTVLAGQTEANGTTWFAAGPVGPQITIASNSLSIAGLAPPQGNRARLAGVDVPAARIGLNTNVTEGTLYYSLILQVADLGTLGANGGTLVAFNDATGASPNLPAPLAARLLVRASGNGYQLGLSKTSTSGDDFLWHPTTFNLSGDSKDPCFIVASYEFVPGPSNDVVRVWINPPLGTFGSLNAPPPDLTTSAGPDISQISSFVLMQHPEPILPAVTFVDEVGVGFTWASVTPGLGASYNWNGGSGDWSLAGNWTPDSGPPGASDTATINSGIATVGADTVVDTLILDGGTLTGPGTLTVSNELTWTAGMMSGTGKTVIGPGATLLLDNDANVVISQRTLENRGMVLATGSAPWLLCDNGAVLINGAGAEWVLENDQAFQYFTGAGSSFENYGAFRKTTATGITVFTTSLAFNNHGTVDVQSGTLQINQFTNVGGIVVAPGADLRLTSGGWATGKFEVPTGATLEWVDGNYTLNNGALLQGAGRYIDSGTLTVDTDVAVQNFDLTGELGGTGTLTVSHQANWTDGAMIGPGRTLIAPEATLYLAHGGIVVLDQRRLVNAGKVDWTGAGNLYCANSAMITNCPGALWEAQGNQAIRYWKGAGSSFNNAGVFRKITGTGPTTFTTSIACNNYGIFSILTGLVVANGGFKFTDSAILNLGIGGTSAGTGFGQVQVGGTVALKGALRVDLVNGFIPAIDDTFTVLTADTRSGTFADFYFPSNNVDMVTSNTVNSVSVRVISVHPTLEKLDFGDAPNSYHTLAVSDGPFHRILAGWSLGASVDEEDDGQPSANADGDDTAGPVNDEDGVTFLTPFVPGVVATARVSVVTDGHGFLNAWLDFNRDGDFADTGEHVLTDAPVVTGSYDLPVTVPLGAVRGPTYARFRLSETPGISFDGSGGVGEVEDYVADLLCAPPELAYPSGLSVLATSQGGAVVDFNVTATSPCGSPPPVFCNPPSGSLFPPGTTMVSCTATDYFGTVSTASFPVSVQEVMAEQTPGGLVLNWAIPNANLEEADDITGPWRTVPVAYSPYTVTINDPLKFYRLRYITGPRLLKVEPAIIAADNSGGAEIYLFGQNLDASSLARVNGQLLTGLTVVDTNILRGHVASLANGIYDVEIVDDANNVLVVLSGGLEAASAPALRIEEPPSSEASAAGRLAMAGGSVQLASGEFIHSAVDMEIPGRGMNFVWGRTYRSRLGQNTEQGNGWDFSCNIYLVQQGPNIVLHDGNGRADVYRLQPDGTYVCNGFSRVIVPQGDGSFKLAASSAGEGNSLALENVQITSYRHQTLDGSLASLENVMISSYGPLTYPGPESSLEDVILSSYGFQSSSGARGLMDGQGGSLYGDANLDGGFVGSTQRGALTSMTGDIYVDGNLLSSPSGASLVYTGHAGFASNLAPSLQSWASQNAASRIIGVLVALLRPTEMEETLSRIWLNEQGYLIERFDGFEWDFGVRSRQLGKSTTTTHGRAIVNAEVNVAGTASVSPALQSDISITVIAGGFDTWDTWDAVDVGTIAAQPGAQTSPRTFPFDFDNDHVVSPSLETPGILNQSSQTLIAEFRPLDGSPTGGKLERLSDANGNETEFSYDETGRLAATIDPVGRATTVAYNANGLIDRVADFTGREVRYTYYQSGGPGGSEGDLKSVRSPIVDDTPNGNDFPQGKTTTYTYTTGLADESLNHNLLTVTLPDGTTVLANTYATTEDPSRVDFDRVIRQSTPNPANPGQMAHVDYHYAPQTLAPGNGFATMKTIVRDRVGNVAEYEFSPHNELIRHRAYTGRADPNLPTTETDNRPAGKLRPGDPPYFETVFNYNADSLMTQITPPDGSRVDFVYERDVDPDAPIFSRQNLRLVRHLPGPLGADQPELVTRFDYAPTVLFPFGSNLWADRLTRSVDPRGFSTRHAYDDRGNCIESRYPVANIVVNREFNAFGQLTAVVRPPDANGHRRRDEFTYYESGPQQGFLRQQVVDAADINIAWIYEYNDRGNLVRYLEPTGADTHISYNALNQVVRLQSAAVTTSNGPVRYEKLFFYNLRNQLVRADIANINEQGVPQPNSHFSSLFDWRIYSFTGRAQEKGDADLASNVLTFADIPPQFRDQFVIQEYGRDANGSLTEIQFGEATAGRQPNNLVQIVRDERGLPFRVVRAPSDPSHSTTQLDYDRNGLLSRMTRGLEAGPDAHLTTYTRDGYGRLTSKEDAMGNVARYLYDAGGNLVQHRVEGELTDVPGNAGNVRLFEQNFTFDAMSRLVRRDIAHFDPASQTPIGDGQSTTEWTYTPNSTLLSQTGDRGFATRYTYDAGRRLSVVTDAKGDTRTYTYDSNSRVTAIEDVEISDLGAPDQRFVTSFGRDELGRVRQVIDSAGNVTEVGFDSRNLRALEIDAKGNVTSLEHDGLGRRVSTSRVLTSDGTGNGTIIGKILTTQAWNDNSRLIAASDGKGNVTRYVYDALNRPIVTQKADGTIYQTGTGAVWPLGQAGPNLAGFANGYDARDNAATITDANGTVVTAQYDLNDRPVSRSIAPGAGVAPDTTFETYEFDGLSHVVRAQNNYSDVAFAYSSLSFNAGSTFVGKVAQGWLTPLRETLNGRTTTYSSDGVGNPLSVGYPGGLAVANSFDGLGQLSAVTANAQSVASLSYVGPRRVERLNLGNGTRSAFNYDGITGVQNSTGDFGVKQIIRARVSRTVDAAVLSDWAFSFEPMDAAGVGRSGFSDWNDILLQRRADLLNSIIHNYGYDSVRRLVSSETDVDGALVEQIGYTLDFVGNRTSVTGGPDPGIYWMDATLPEPADAEVNQYTTTSFDARQYDRQGNLRITDSFGFTYDYRNRLVAFQDAVSGNTVTYRYDCLNRRIERTVTPSAGSPVTTRYLFRGMWEIEERDGAGAVLATFIRGTDGQMLAMQRGGETYYFHPDAARNTILLTDSAGNLAEQYDYTDFGAPQFFAPNGQALPASAVGNGWLPGGSFYDAETGLIHSGGNYFEPRIGRRVNRFTLPSGF
jgi:YD repeat-containing protein